MPVNSDLVKQLFQMWKESGVAQEQLPKIDDAKSAIERVLNLVEGTAGQSIGVPQVVAAITAFQRLKGISANEGILTNGLADSIKRLIVMDDNPSPSTKKIIRRPVSDTDSKAFWIRYWVDTQSLSAFASPATTRRLCAEAWDLWLEHTQFLFVREVDEPDDGVVTVTAGDVPGNAVGKAPVAGPGNFNRSGLQVTLDIADINESDDYFRAIAAHEFGHIMGIGHQGKSGSLMSVTVLDSIQGLAPSDIQAAQRIYGKPPEIPPPPAPPPDFIVPDF